MYCSINCDNITDDMLYLEHILGLRILKSLHSLQKDVSTRKKDISIKKSHIVKAQMALDHKMRIDPPP